MELLVFLIVFGIFMVMANTCNLTDKDMVSE